MRVFLLLSLVFLVCFSLAGAPDQSGRIDSLRLLAQTAKDAPTRIDAYKDLAFAHFQTDTELTLRYCDTLEMIARRAALPRTVAKAEYFRAVVWWVRGDNLRAIDHCREGLAILSDPGSKKERENVATLNNLLGSIYVNQGLNEEAAEILLEAARMSLINQDSQGYAYSLVNVGTAYEKHGNDSSARQHTLQAIVVLKDLDEKHNLVTAYNNLASYTDDPAAGLAYLAEAERYGLESGNHFQLTHTYHNSVSPLLETGRLPEALVYERRAYRQAREYDNAQLHISTSVGMGQLMKALGRRDSAIYFLREGIALAETVGMKGTLKTGYLDLAEVFREQRQLDSAYLYLTKQLNQQDSLHQSKVAERMAASNARFGVAERDREIAEQRVELTREEGRRNRLLLAALAILLAFAALATYLFQRNRLRRRELALEVEKREAEAQRLRELDGLKTRFFTNISHELRTPLTLITSPLEQAIARLKQLNLKPDLELAHRNSRNLLTLVNEILDLSKLEAGQLTKTEAPFAPEPFLRRVLYAFESLAALRGVTIAYAGDFPIHQRLTTDVGKLEKILNNLLSNALKFSPEGSTVTLHAECDGTRLHVRVTDEGSGIDRADLPRLFDRYYQSAANEEHHAGTGIGLNLSRQLARFLGGDLLAESQEGEGSTFSLSLPVVVGVAPAGADQLGADFEGGTSQSILSVPEGKKEEASEVVVGPEAADWRPTSGRPRLLLVEDNPEMSDYLRRNLGGQYDCVTVSNGRAALSALSRESFDLISSDVMMPKMDGFELRERINASTEWRGIPFLLLTARYLEADKLRGFRLGVDDYVTKPFSLPELRARIENLLQNKGIRDGLRLAADELPDPSDDLARRAEALVHSRLDDPTFSVAEMAKSLGHGQRQLARLLSAATGLTPVRFILEIRLQKARELLESRAFGTVAEVRYEIGIESASYFNRKFRERFGRTPGEEL